MLNWLSIADLGIAADMVATVADNTVIVTPQGTGFLRDGVVTLMSGVEYDGPLDDVAVYYTETVNGKNSIANAVEGTMLGKIDGDVSKCGC